MSDVVQTNPADHGAAGRPLQPRGHGRRLRLRLRRIADRAGRHEAQRRAVRAAGAAGARQCRACVEGRGQLDRQADAGPRLRHRHRVWPAFNALYAKWAGGARPARCVVPVPQLHYGFKIEIEAVAREIAGPGFFFRLILARCSSSRRCRSTDNSAPPGSPAGRPRRDRTCSITCCTCFWNSSCSGMSPKKICCSGCPWPSLQLKQLHCIVVGDIGAHVLVELLAVDPVPGLLGLLERVVRPRT